MVTSAELNSKMVKWAIVVIFLLELKSSVISYSYVGTEKSLRQNIADLLRGTLKFNDENIPYYEEELRDVTPKNHSEYDFIVIGAGSAGSTVASRLSESRGVTVLLIEAGIKEYPIMDIPNLALILSSSDQISWKYQTEASAKCCRGLKGSKFSISRGKVMGGSSILNYMLATRGDRRDYDTWANITGDISWSYKQMLKYLKKLENFNVKDVEFDSKYRSKNGPMYISSARSYSKMSQIFLESGRELGYPSVDYNGKNQLGFSYFQTTTRVGERWSTNRGYLHPARNRKNLFLTRNSHVNKILINKRTRVAYGVQFSKLNKLYRVNARKEVILCAGAVNSPQILMLSGVGPKRSLNSLGIDVIRDAPVGENFIDHVAYAGLIFFTNDTKVPGINDILDPKNTAVKDYIENRNGSLANGIEFDALAFIDSRNIHPSHKNPDIELIFSATAGIADPHISKMFGISDEYRNKMIAETNGRAAWSVWSMLMKPKSRGKIVLNSSNPRDKPRLYANILSDQEDVKTLTKGIRFAMKMSKTRAFQKYNSTLYHLPLPCDKYEFDSDNYWECAVRTFSLPMNHLSGTCRMGPENDSTSIVNSQLKVIGTKRLRVADTSIMPEIISSHTNIPTIAIAEKVSDMIKKDWNC